MGLVLNFLKYTDICVGLHVIAFAYRPTATARSARHEPDTHDDPRRLVRGLLSDTRAFPREDVVGLPILGRNSSPPLTFRL